MLCSVTDVVVGCWGLRTFIAEVWCRTSFEYLGALFESLLRCSGIVRPIGCKSFEGRREGHLKESWLRNQPKASSIAALIWCTGRFYSITFITRNMSRVEKLVLGKACTVSIFYSRDFYIRSPSILNGLRTEHTYYTPDRPNQIVS